MSNWKWYVYVVECLDNTYYTGCTWNIPNRVDQHISRLGSKYTAKHGFKKLVYFEEWNNLQDARKREKQIKDWNQEKKKKLISGEWKKDY
jgi:putative endonuclease